MASSAEYDYNCPVCCEIFKTPVILSCSHSVCKECLQQFWRTKKTQECPVCRRRSSRDCPPINLALQNLCESFLKERNESRSSGSEEICSLHSEKLKLFCLEDKQSVCVECFTSQKHVSHTVRPISEVVPSYKEELNTVLKSLQEKLKKRDQMKGRFEETVQHIKGFNSGKHCWDVEVKESSLWILGVTTASNQRKGDVFFDTDVWSVQYRSSDRFGFPVKQKLERVRVDLDYDRGTVLFSDPQCKSYANAKKILKEAGIRFQTPFTKMRIHWDSGVKTYNEAKEVEKDLRDRGYLVADTGDAAGPTTSLERLEARNRSAWQQAGRERRAQASRRARKRLEDFRRKNPVNL
ncbi:nuclear factor 7, ovary-like [Sinocyclocheilus rhinocerous]|uniref:nuclear factor 7, ovary-like n=1 Tax=Sinocyclocheilus rhinocerous TaxID=307959 RepID=UPI0007B7C4F3|nr:PREDICTED: nuclear factor 7, ovary-like [Sinocyclocheilus rhinocerous]